MTIPRGIATVPGPFSGIQSFYENFIAAQENKRQRLMQEAAIQRQNDVQNVELFSQMLPFMQARPELVGAGPGPFGMPMISPTGQDTFDVPGNVGESFKRLTGNIPRLSPSPEMRQQTAAARVAEGTVEPTITTAKAKAKGATAEAEVVSAEAEKWLPVLQDMTPAVFRQHKGILPPEAAELGEKVMQEKMITELASQTAARGEIDVATRMQEAFRKRFPKDTEMQKVGAFIAMGGLGYLISDLQQRYQLSNNRSAVDRERMQFMTQLEGSIRQGWTQAEARFAKGLEDATTTMQIEFERNPEKKRKMIADATAEYIKRNPEPNYDNVVKEILKSHQISDEEFQGISRDILRLQTNAPSPATSQPAAPAAPTLPPLSQEEKDLAARDPKFKAFLRTKGYKLP